MVKRKRYYNRTNTCDICGINFALMSDSEYPRREYNENGEWTGRWTCKKCYHKKMNKLPDSYSNVIKSLRDHRLGNLDPKSEVGKGRIFEAITCRARGVKNLNIENDNFAEPIDHDRDFKYGILQTKGAVCSRESWDFGCKSEQNKVFDNLIVYCMDENMENIERVYIFPWDEIIKRTCITIYKNPSRRTWYEKYRLGDIELYNGAYHNLDDNDLIGIKKVKKIKNSCLI